MAGEQTERGKEIKRNFELASAASREEAGTASAIDTENLTFARDELGLDVQPVGTSAPQNINVAEGADQTISGTPLTGDATIAQAAAEGVVETIDQSIADNTAQIAKQQAEQDQLRAESERLETEAGELADQPLQTAQTLFEESEIEETNAALTETKNQINALERKLNLTLADLENQAIPMEFITGQQALIERKAMSQISYLQSKAAVLQDQMQFAREQLNFFFDASMIGFQVRADNLGRLLDYNRQDIINLDAKEEALAERNQALELARAEKLEQDRDKILDLMANNQDAWVGADISMDMTYEEMVTNMTQWAAAQPVAHEFKPITVNGRLFAFDTTTAQYIDSGIVVPKQSVADGNGSNVAKIKFGTEDNQRLFAAGFNSDEIDQIEKDVEVSGVNAVLTGIDSPQQQKVLLDVLSGVTATQSRDDAADSKVSITQPMISTLLSIGELPEQYAGMITGGFFGKGAFTEAQARQQYVNDTWASVQVYRDAGFNDAEILEKFQ